MKAYAIFDGGGVKAAALAGCLAAAEGKRIEFCGYGGTSAGAIIATLASVGYSGVDILELLQTDFHPARMLEDEGQLLRDATGAVKEIIPLLTADKWVGGKLWNFFAARRKYAHLREPIFVKLGLYSGELLRTNLARLIRAKLPVLAEDAEITFEALEDAGCIPLKIVASDLTNRRALIFEHPRSRKPNDRSPEVRSVIDAVRISAGYPLVFAPFKTQAPEETVLVDGGLASNLPSFLFSKEQEMTRFPILAFDLVSSPQTTPIEEIDALLYAMLETALEASDHLPLRPRSGIFQIPVLTPPEIETLDFNLDPREIRELYNSGHTAATEWLNGWARLDPTRGRGGGLQQELRTFYGDQKLFAGPLWALATWVEMNTRAENVRVTVMLPTGREDNSRVIVYHDGFEPGDTDDQLELDEFGGCTGRALQTRSPTYADLVQTKTDFSAWNLTEHQQKLVCPRQRAMFSVPIFAWSGDDKLPVSELPIIGVLSFDSSTILKDTGWYKVNEQGLEVPDSEVATAAQTWSDVISILLRA